MASTARAWRPDTPLVEGKHGQPNTDATPCIAVDAQGNFLALFQSEENGYLHKFVFEQGQLVQEWRENIRRTDLISVAMMRDGTILVGTRYFAEPPWNETHGFVYAVWGFDQ